MSEEYEVVWTGKQELIEGLERDYAAMCGDGWDPIWVPTSPLTTPWWQFASFWALDPERYVPTAMERRGRQRGMAGRILKDWSREYTGVISQRGSHR